MKKQTGLALRKRRRTAVRRDLTPAAEYSPILRATGTLTAEQKELIRLGWPMVIDTPKLFIRVN